MPQTTDILRSASFELRATKQQLSQAITYLPPSERTAVTDALEIAYSAHCGQTRKSGEPYIVHPISVAILLANWRMDSETVIAGLLHDTVEDTDMTLDQISQRFGSNVARIVEGVTKVSKQREVAPQDKKTENLRGMLLAMSREWRVVVVKLADRLHNMQTLQHMPPHKQERIASETMEIFVPLAVRLGSWQLAQELEQSSLQYMTGRLALWEELNHQLDHMLMSDEVLSQARVGSKLWQHQNEWKRQHYVL